MAENNDVLINAEIKVNKKELEKVLDGLAGGITKALSTTLSSSVKAFATNLGKNIQISFNDTVLGELKKPIKIKIDTDDAKIKIDSLVASLSTVVGQLTVATKVEKKTSTGSTKKTDTKSSSTDTTDKDIATQANDVAKYTLLLGQLKNQASSFGSSGQGMVKSLNDIENSLVGIGKASDEGIFSPAQISALGKLGNKISDIQNKIDDFNSSIKEISAIAGSGKSPTSQLEKGLELTSKGLVQYGFNQNSVAAITKKVAAGVSYLKEQYNLLFDEVKKGDQADLGRILLTKKRIDNAEALAASRLSTIQQNRGNIVEPVSDKQIEDLFKNEQQARDKARKAEIQGEKDSAKIKKDLDKDYTDTWKRLLDEREKAADLAAKEEVARQKSANARRLDNFKLESKADEEQRKTEEKARVTRERVKEIKDLKSTTLNRGNLENIAENLRKKRSNISVAEDIPINVLNKQTRQYDSTIVRLEVDLENLNKEYKLGNITVEEASRRYKKLNDDVKKLQIGIASIDAKRLAKEFNQEEADPRRLGYRLGILAFTLNSVGASLSNFSRNFFQVFDQLGQAAEPIERLTNNLALQVKQQKISASQQTTILTRLREIGDLPGSSVESANETFNALQKINISLQERLDLTEGIAKLAAAPGGTKESAKQLSDTLAAISLEKVVDEDRFKTIRKSGGVAVTDLINTLGFSGGRDIEKFGIANFIKEVGTQLKLLEVPASTTSDRINRLRSRLSEMGVAFGKIVAPGLEQLNILLRDKIVPEFDKLVKRFESLSEGTRNTIGGLIIAVPVLTGLAGGFVSLAGAIGFIVSLLYQAKGLLTFIPGALAKILPAAAAGTATGAPIAGFIGPQLIQVGLLTRAGVALGNVFKALTGPIGIAIQLILSVFTSLYKNTDGIRDRLISTFIRVDKSVRDLLKSLGLGDIGLLGILEAVFNVVTEIGNFIGGILISALTALVANFANIIDNLREMIDLFKSGDILGGFLSFGKLVLNAIGGLIKTIVTEVVAFTIESIARALENTIGGGILSGAFREGADSLRRSNGTDNESIARQNAEIELERQKLDFEQQKADIIKESADAVKRTEEERQELLKKNLGELNDLIDKSKDDYAKFVIEQQISKIKLFQDQVQESTKTGVETFKTIIESTSNLNDINQVFARTTKLLEENRRSLIRSQGGVNLRDALKDFTESFSDKGKLRPLFESAKNGRLEFTLLVGEIEKAKKSTSLDGLSKSLSEIERLSKSVNLDGLEGDFSTLIQNSIEKNKSVIEASGLSVQNYIQEYSKILIDLKKLEIQRVSAIQKEKDAIEFEKESRKIELDRKIEDIRRERKLLIQERSPILKSTELQNEEDLRRLSSLRQLQDEKRRLNAEIRELGAEFEKEQRLILADPASDEFSKQNAIKALENTNSLYQALSVSSAQYRNKVDELNVAQEGYNALQKEDIELSATKRRNSVLEFYNSINESLRSINSLSQEAFDKFVDIFSRFRISFGRQRESDPVGLGNVINQLERLIEITGGADPLGQTTLELQDLLAKAKKDGSDLNTIIDEVIKSLVKLGTLDLTNKRIDAENTFNSLVQDYNVKNPLGTEEISKVSGGITKDNLGSLFSTLLINQNPNEASSNKTDSLLTSVSKLAGLTDISTETEQRILALGQRIKESGIGDAENLGKDLLDILVRSTKEEQKLILDTLFGSDELSKTDSSRAQILSQGIALYAATRAESDAKLAGTLKTKADLIESSKVNSIKTLDNRIQSEEQLNNQLEFQISKASGERLEKLLREQNDVKLRIIEFNYQKLDIEAAYEIQKAIINAAGDEAEIRRIKEQGERRRAELQLQRDKDIEDLVRSGSGNTNSKGELVDKDGNVIRLSNPSKIDNLGTGDTSGDITNSTITSAGPSSGRPSGEAVAEGGIAKAINILTGVKDSAVQAGNSILDFYDKIASGEGVLTQFKKLIFGTDGSLKSIGMTFQNVAAFAIAAFGQSFAQALADVLVNGGSFLKALGKFFGQVLIQIGTMLVSLGTAALIAGVLSKFFPWLTPILNPSGIGEGAAIAAIAIGGGLIAAGALLGGGGGKTASVSNAGTTASANSSAGNTGQVDYDPEKDPKLIYQKALRAQVYIDIKRDDGSIVKAVVKQVNRNPAFANLIGNQRTGFVL